MLMLPSHYDQYEPLNKQANTFMSRLRQKRLAVIVLLCFGLLGGFELYRLGSSTNAQSTTASKGTTSTSSSWYGLAWGKHHQGVSDQKEKVAQGGTDGKDPYDVHVAAASIPVVHHTTDPYLASTSPSSSPSSSSSIATYTIDEADWHMPAEVVLDRSDPLMKSRFKPFFTQEKEDIHREKGFGTAINLQEAPFIRRSLYRHLLQSFNSFAKEHSFHFWLAHGSLLGQHWGQKIMSGDTDVDLQCTLGALHRVKKYEGILWEDRFELVVNPHYLVRRSRNFRYLGLDKNVIDARWIDVLTGHYIDITALSSVHADKPLLDRAPFVGDRKANIVQDKSPHRYKVDLISPTQSCQFEGMDMWCPNDAHAVLLEEYKNYKLPHFQTWRFNESIQAFNEVTCQELVNMYLYPNQDNCDEECRFVVSHERHLKWNYLVIQGDGGSSKKGCLLKVSFMQDNQQNTREYWGREVESENVTFKNARNITYPPVVL